MKRQLALAAVAAIIAPLALGVLDAQGPDTQRGAPTARIQRKGPRAIPNQYIVVLQDEPGEQAAAQAGVADYAAVLGRVQGVLRGRAAVPQHVYASAVRGFSARMTEADAIAVSQEPGVAYVEEDGVMEAIATQTTAPWGLDRLDQRARPPSGSYSYTTVGSGVRVYVIDTGIRTTHAQFGGRASGAFTAINDGRGTTDCNGHGTHVAGIVGGSRYGVAKTVRLHSIRVLGCGGSGTTSGVIAGVDWVHANHVKPAVANMSLSGARSSSLDTAVRNSIAAGVTYAIAAGNSSVDATNFSPARVAEAITVGSSTSGDARSSFSNIGSVVDIFAPGSSIISAWYTSDSATATLSGTSMAAPHVAGAAARYLQTNPTASPRLVRDTLINASTTSRLTGIPTGTHNRLLFWSSTK